ncbi:hypothetical protein ACFWIW_22005 [Amycolatopsis sp. NPDC058340]|uniref:hypothetical protein n=1 Tax=Amycolatopsis sp. NPDC058340 TaxID=3346453 RepID=UPI0036636AD2
MFADDPLAAVATLGGSAEQVWSIVPVTYDLMPPDPTAVKSIKEEFLSQTAGPRDAGGQVSAR